MALFTNHDPNLGVAQPVALSQSDQRAIEEAQRTAQLDSTLLTNAELLKLAGWTPQDYTTARSVHALPEPVAYRGGEPLRLRRDILRWVAEQERLAQEKVRLVARLRKV
jgi:hypothetical protein